MLGSSSRGWKAPLSYATRVLSQPLWGPRKKDILRDRHEWALRTELCPELVDLPNSPQRRCVFVHPGCYYLACKTTAASRKCCFIARTLLTDQMEIQSQNREHVKLQNHCSSVFAEIHSWASNLDYCQNCGPLTFKNEVQAILVSRCDAFRLIKNVGWDVHATTAGFAYLCIEVEDKIDFQFYRLLYFENKLTFWNANEHATCQIYQT